jgi:hypothetical protein
VRTASRWIRVLGLAPLALAAGCGGPNAASSLAKPPELRLQNQAKCGVQRSQARPLVVEWPSADRGALEAQARKGLVVVRYEGCDMEVLRQCRAPGRYAFSPFTRKDDHVSIRTEDELYASVPVHAAELEGKLRQSGHLEVAMTLVGSWDADRPALSADELTGDCARATHVISALTAGAFELSAGGAAEVRGGGSGLGVHAGAASGAEKELLNRDGYASACERATSADTAPPDGCGAIVRLEVAPLAPARAAAAAPRGMSLVGTTIPDAPTRAPAPPSAQRTVGNVAIGVGTAGLVGGLVAGVVAIAKKSALERDGCGDAGCPKSAESDLTGYHTAAGVSNVLLIAGGGLLVGGIVVAATAPSRRPAAGAALTLGPGTAALTGRFW